MFSNIYRIQKLKILYEFDVRFHTKDLSCFTDYKTRIGGRSYSSTTDNSSDFYTNKTKQQLQT